jgi:nucleotide-binding universal stress UspA family protein
MATNKTRILAVVDPTRNEQWALQKAISIAKNRDDCDVYAFLCIYSDAECDDSAELRSVELRRYTIWLDELLADLNDSGVNVEPVVEWSYDWRAAISEAAKDVEADLVVKKASGRPKSLASSDRQLTRTLQSALLLVKHDPVRELQKVLIAVDFNATDEAHKVLNDVIMNLGKRIRGSSEKMELHAVNAYSAADKFVHPPDVAKTLDIERFQAHVHQGNAADIIPSLAHKIDADLVIVGNVSRRGLSGITVGNTSEKILADIETDVLVLVREEEIERAAA